MLQTSRACSNQKQTLSPTILVPLVVVGFIVYLVSALLDLFVVPCIICLPWIFKMAGLPFELWMKVFECLPATDLCATVPLVCWDLRHVAYDEALWKKLYLHHFNIVVLSHRNEYSKIDDWRHKYMDRRRMVTAKGKYTHPYHHYYIKFNFAFTYIS